MDYNFDLYVMPLDGKREPKNITADNPGNDFAPVYSPNGKMIAFLRQTTKFFYADHAASCCTPAPKAKTTNSPQISTAHVVPSSGVPRIMGLFFEAEDEGCHRIHVVGTKDRIKPITSGFTDALPASAGTAGIAIGSPSSAPISGRQPRLYAMESADQEPIVIDHFNDALRHQWDLGEVKNITYKGAEDEDVQMWVVYPPNFDKSKKWPCLMMIHGGPHGAITTDFHYRWNAHLFASKGYVVAIPNFHGSSRLRPKIHRFDHRRHGDQAVHRCHEGDRFYGSVAVYRQDPHDRGGGKLRRLHDGLAERAHRSL